MIYTKYLGLKTNQVTGNLFLYVFSLPVLFYVPVLNIFIFLKIENKEHTLTSRPAFSIYFSKDTLKISQDHTIVSVFVMFKYCIHVNFG